MDATELQASIDPAGDALRIWLEHHTAGLRAHVRQTEAYQLRQLD